MALKRTITISANGNAYTLSDDAGVVFYQGSTASTECYYANNSLTLQNIYTGKEVIQSTLYSDIINASTGLAFTSLANLQTYLATNFFRKATGGGGNQLATPVVTVGTPTNATVPLSLVAIANATQYIWQRATNAGFTTGVTTLAGTGTSITDTGLAGSTTYYYRAAATALGAGYTNSAYSTVVSATTAALPTLAQTNPVIGTPTSTTIPLSWTYPTGGTNALLRRSLSPTMSSPTTVYSGTATSVTDTGLTPNTNYYYDLVISGTGYNNSPAGTTSGYTTQGIVLVPLTGVNKSSPAPTQVANTYTNVIGSEQYGWTTKTVTNGQPFIVQCDIVNDYANFYNGHIGVHNFTGNVDNAYTYIFFANTGANKGKMRGQVTNSTYWGNDQAEITITNAAQMRVRGDGTNIYCEVNPDGSGWVTALGSPVTPQINGLYVVFAVYDFNNPKPDKLANVQVYPDVNSFTPPAPDPTGLTTQELRYDNTQQAKSSLKYTDYATAAGNGDSVGVVLDKIGSLPLVYAGIASPTIIKAPPKLIDTLWLQFDNQPNTNYDSPNFTAKTPPFEVVIVSRDLPGQLYEAKMENGFNGCYLGNFGLDMRVFDQNGVITGSGNPPKYYPIIQRVVVKTTGIDYWLNGTKVGTFSFSGLTAPQIAGSTTKTIQSISTFTNSMDFDFGALYFKGGSFFTDSDWTTTIFPDFSTKWGIGVLPNQILLSNIGWTRSGTTYTPAATVINTPSGVTVAAMSAWDYEWYWGSDQHGLGDQTKFSTSYQVQQTDFPNNGTIVNGVAQTNVSIKVRMRPKSTVGGVWRYLSGIFGSYTQAAQSGT